MCSTMSANNNDALAAALKGFVAGLQATAEEGGWSSGFFDLEFLTDAVNDALYGADFLGAIEELELIDRFVDHVRTALVIACRSAGTPWDEIGSAMGRERQWAWRRYHRVADVSAELDERTRAEFKQAIPDFAKLFPKWGVDIESMAPDERRAVSLLERQAERVYERVGRALALTTDEHRRSLVEKEQEEKRANKPGRRPGPQGSAGDEGA